MKKTTMGPAPTYFVKNGDKFFELTVIDDTVVRISKTRKVLCQCSCGNTKMAGIVHLHTGSIKSCGCKKKTTFHDLTGKTFNNLTAIKYVGKDNYNNHTYIFKCKCGNEKTWQGSDVKTGKVKSCGCKNFSKDVIDAMNNDDAIYSNEYSHYKGRIGKRVGLDEFTLTFPEFKKLITDPCHYCGIVGSRAKKRTCKMVTKYIHINGIDRVDNNKGYILDNCVTACRTCNQAKHTNDVNYFKSWIERTYNHLKAKGEI